MTKRSSLVEIRYPDKYAYATRQLLYKVRLYRLRDNDSISKHIFVRISRFSGYRDPVIKISLYVVRYSRPFYTSKNIYFV